MTELDPRRIGTPEQAQMVVQRVLCAVFRLCTDELLDKAQEDLDKFEGKRNG